MTDRKRSPAEQDAGTPKRDAPPTDARPSPPRQAEDGSASRGIKTSINTDIYKDPNRPLPA